MRLSKGRNVFFRKSKGGACILCVPPSSVSLLGPDAVMSAGKMVCSTSVLLPAVPTAKRYSPAWISPGANCRVFDPSAAPSTLALPISLAARTPVKCWRNKPGFSRLARIFSMRKGCPMHSERLRAVRSICPPPSPEDPSMRIIKFSPGRALLLLRGSPHFRSSLDANDLSQRVHNFHQVALRGHHGLNWLISRGRFVDDLSVLSAFDSCCHSLVVFDRKTPLRFGTGHRAS